MDILSWHLSRLRFSLLSVKQRMALSVVFTWNAYCKPCPSDVPEMLTLISVCVLISSVISTLLAVWMTLSLAYSLPAASVIAGVCACILSVLLVLIHPVRCVVTVAMPTLGTKQGRKVFLSAALFCAISVCIPNVSRNIVSILQTLKCSADNATQSMLESSSVPYKAMVDIKDYLDNIAFFIHSKTLLKLDSMVDIEIFKRNLFEMAERMRAKLTVLLHSTDLICLVFKKLIAALFVMIMIISSVVYVKGYLTHIRYDNMYCTQQLLEALKRVSGDDTLPETYRKKLVKTLGVRMNRRELQHSLWGVVVVLFYALMCGIVLGLDYFVYSTLQMLLSQTSDLPAVDVAVDVTTKTTLIHIINNEVHQRYPYTVQMMPQECVYALSAPESSTLTTICVSLIIGFFMLMGEVFARRLRRKVCASFYPTREDQRIEHLLWKILQERERERERRERK